MIQLTFFHLIIITFFVSSFYINNAYGQDVDLPIFTNVQNQTGIPFVGKIGQAATWGDFNVDGWPDLFLSNSDRGPRRIGKRGDNAKIPQQQIQRSFFLLIRKVVLRISQLT